MNIETWSHSKISGVETTTALGLEKIFKFLTDLKIHKLKLAD